MPRKTRKRSRRKYMRGGSLPPKVGGEAGGQREDSYRRKKPPPRAGGAPRTPERPQVPKYESPRKGEQVSYDLMMVAIESFMSEFNEIVMEKDNLIQDLKSHTEKLESLLSNLTMGVTLTTAIKTRLQSATPQSTGNLLPDLYERIDLMYDSLSRD